MAGRQRIMFWKVHGSTYTVITWWSHLAALWYHTNPFCCVQSVAVVLSFQRVIEHNSSLLLLLLLLQIAIEPSGTRNSWENCLREKKMLLIGRWKGAEWQELSLLWKRNRRSSRVRISSETNISTKSKRLWLNTQRWLNSQYYSSKSYEKS